MRVYLFDVCSSSMADLINLWCKCLLVYLFDVCSSSMADLINLWCKCLLVYLFDVCSSSMADACKIKETSDCTVMSHIEAFSTMIKHHSSWPFMIYDR